MLWCSLMCGSFVVPLSHHLHHRLAFVFPLFVLDMSTLDLIFMYVCVIIIIFLIK